MSRRTLLAAAAVAMLGVGTAAAPGAATEVPRPVRFATFNASLNRAHEGELLADLSTPSDPQARQVAEIVQRNRPDVLLLNEFDHVPGNAAVDAFRRNYLAVGQHGAEPIDYPHVYTAPVNTGVPSGFDLDNDGTIGGGNDAHGFGDFPGQYGMVVLSKFPIDAGAARTFQHFRWSEMPGALRPDDPATPEPADWYTDEAWAHLRLSSKSHWDLPIDVRGRTVHFLVSHPTPPSFDGPEDRNGLRNHDEIRFWADYVDPARSGYLHDDAGRRGGLDPDARFVIAGDQNSDPVDGDSVAGAPAQITHAARVLDPHPGSIGAVRASVQQGGANRTHRGSSFTDTGDFDDEQPGNLRVDYLLPSLPMIPLRSEVFWPTGELARLDDASDHHLVRLDVLPN